jgi:dihydropyrimidinase
MEVKVSMSYPEILSSNHKTYFDNDYEEHKSDFRALPKGISSLGALFPLFYDLLIKKYKWELPKLMQKFSVNPATLAKIYPRKGVIAVGSDADLVIFSDNGPERTIQGSDSQNFNVWENYKTNVDIKSVFVRGNLIVKDGKLKDENVCMGKPLCQL